MTLSKYGDFPSWMSLLEFSFVTNHPKTDKPICVLRIIPTGYECDVSRVVYGIYVHGFLEFEPNVCYPSLGDFLEPSALRELVTLILDPSTKQTEVVVQGEAMKLKFSPQENGGLTLDGHLGIGGWGDSYLTRLFRDYPFQKDLRFKCSLSERSLRNTLDDLQKLLSIIDNIEAGETPIWHET